MPVQKTTLLHRAIEKIKSIFRQVVEKIVDSLSSMLPDEDGRQRFRQIMRPHLCQNINVPVSRTKIQEIKNSQRGGRCFLIGTGPSISDLDLKKISRDEDYVFLVNKGYLLAEAFGKRPDAIMISNPHAFFEYGQDALSLPWRHIFISSAIASRKEGEGQIITFSQWEHPKMSEGFFQFDMTKPLYDANTVILSALQVAVWMGFDEIYIAGVDLSFEPERPHFYKTVGKELERSRTVSVKMTNRMQAGFAAAARMLRERGFPRVYNVGVGGNLEHFPRRAWNDLFDCDF